jgi:hypothetical protein
MQVWVQDIHNDIVISGLGISPKIPETVKNEKNRRNPENVPAQAQKFPPKPKVSQNAPKSLKMLQNLTKCP